MSDATSPGERPPDFDVQIGARMRRVRFNVVPETKVWFEGFPAYRGEAQAERENLPDELQEGTTYRDAGVNWRASGWVEADVYTEIEED